MIYNYERTYKYMLELVNFNEAEDIDDLDNAQKRIVVVSFLMDANEEELKNMYKLFTVTRALLFNLINIKRDNEDILYIERTVVEEIFSIKRGLFQDILEKALNDFEEKENQTQREKQSV